MCAPEDKLDDPRLRVYINCNPNDVRKTNIFSCFVVAFCRSKVNFDFFLGFLCFSSRTKRNLIDWLKLKLKTKKKVVSNSNTRRKSENFVEEEKEKKRTASSCEIDCKMSANQFVVTLMRGVAGSGKSVSGQVCLTFAHFLMFASAADTRSSDFRRERRAHCVSRYILH